MRLLAPVGDSVLVELHHAKAAGDAKPKVMRCRRSQCQAFDGPPKEVPRERLRWECFRRAMPDPQARAGTGYPEEDLFQGIAPARAVER